MTTIDPELAAITLLIGTQRAHTLAATLTTLADDIRADADTLGTAPVPHDPADQAGLRILTALPPATFDQSRFWRYQLAQAATQLAADIHHWGAPIPRCTGEEMVLHLALSRAAALTTHHHWNDLVDYLFQDTDVLMLYELPAEAITQQAGGVNLAPTQWFTEFDTPFPLPARP